jgi:hypothetical protein
MIWRFTYAKMRDSQPALKRNCALTMAVDSSAKLVQKIYIAQAP